MDSLSLRYRYPPATVNQLIALNQSRGGGGVIGNGVSGLVPSSSYQLLDVLHEEEESSSNVSSPSTAQLVENQQQLEQLNLHQHGFASHGGCGTFLRCMPPSIVITDMAKSSNKGGPVSGQGGAIAMR